MLFTWAFIRLPWAGTASVNDDDVIPVLSIAASATHVQEGSGGATTATFEVLRTGNLAGPVAAIWGYDPITTPSIRATDAADFVNGTYPSGVLQLADGQSRATLTVQVAADDLAEHDETFAIRLLPKLASFHDVNAGQSVATMVISNDDTIADLLVADAKGMPYPATPTIYSGPVREIDKECILLGPENLVVAARGPNWFIRTGSGDDAIALAEGRNIVDGGTGSNFIATAAGADTVFVDVRGATASTWSTVTTLGPSDMATIWGLSSGFAAMQWMDDWGAAGYAGITLMATVPGAPVACLTLAGLTRADLDSGRLLMDSGYDWASASDYSNIWLRW